MDADRPLKRLTKKNLKAFDKMRRRTTTDLKSKSSRATSRSSAITGSTNKSVPTTDSNFPRLAFENGILSPDHSAPHENLRSHQDKLDRARNTASPSESEYKGFAHRIRRAPNEMTMVFETSTLLKGHVRGYGRVYNQAFDDFPKNVRFNNGLSATQPDMIEGLEMTEFDPFPIRQELGGAAVPTSERDPLTLSHLAGEWKGPGKDMILAETQAAYDGACMVFGRNEARSFLNSSDPAGHAYVHTFTTDGTTLNTFAHYSSESDEQIRYHQYPTSSSFLISSFDEFKKSRRRLRNLQDDAKQNSEALRDELNEKWSVNRRSYVVPDETAASTDCNSSDNEDGEDPTNQLLAEYWTSLPTNNQQDSARTTAAGKEYALTFTENHQHESSVQGPAANSLYAQPSEIYQATNENDPFVQTSTSDNGYASPNVLTFPLITPPRSSQDTSLPIESSEKTDANNMRGHRRTRQRTRVLVDARKTRRKH